MEVEENYDLVLGKNTPLGKTLCLGSFGKDHNTSLLTVGAFFFIPTKLSQNFANIEL